MLYRRVFFSPEGEAGAQAANPAAQAATAQPQSPTATPPQAAPASGTAPAAPANQPAEPDPVYFSQFAPEKRVSEDYKRYVSRCKSITDLADAYIASEKEKDARVRIPTKDSSTDDVKAFMKTLGIPDTKDGYHINGEEKLQGDGKGVVDAFKEISWRNGLTAQQAQKQYEFVQSLINVGQKKITEAHEEAKKNFDGQLVASYQDKFQSESERQAAAKEAVSLFAEFATATGTAKRMMDSGLAYDPTVVKAVAEYMKAKNGKIDTAGGTTVHGGNNAAKPEGSGFGYSDAWNERYGRK